MRVNPRYYRESFSRSALKRELHRDFAELRALLFIFGSAELLVEMYYDYVRYA